MRCYEDDGNRTALSLQLCLEIQSRHARHTDIRNQALNLWKLAGRQEIFGRSERGHRETTAFQQELQRGPDQFVIIYDGD